MNKKAAVHLVYNLIWVIRKNAKLGEKIKLEQSLEQLSYTCIIKRGHLQITSRIREKQWRIQDFSWVCVVSNHDRINFSKISGFDPKTQLDTPLGAGFRGICNSIKTRTHFVALWGLRGSKKVLSSDVINKWPQKYKSVCLENFLKFHSFYEGSHDRDTLRYSGRAINLEARKLLI